MDVGKSQRKVSTAKINYLLYQVGDRDGYSLGEKRADTLAGIKGAGL